MQEIEFEIDREAVKHYFLTLQFLASAGWFAVFSPIVLIIPLLLLTGRFGFSGFLTSIFLGCVIFGIFLGGCFVFCQWLCPQQANNLRYRLEGDILCVDGGVFFLFRKSIPLERITDVALVQGPVLRYFNIWAMRIQTAGSPQAEATLYGVREPEKIRELILARRKSINGEKTEDV